ncbi:MAG: PIN domain-containing protein [Candidatus Sumerlaeaceae bacterium]
MLVDANVFLRLFLDDDRKKASRCAALLAKAAKGEQSLFVTDMCVAEIVWTLTSFYELPRDQVADHLEAILNLHGLMFSDYRVLLDTLLRYRSSNADFTDCYHCAVARRRKVAICSYDRDFDSFSDIERLEP